MDVPRIKVCGITRVQDAELAIELGAWAIGMIFAESPRQVSEPKPIAGAVHRRALLTGVFVDHSLDDLAALHDALRFDVIQLHGDEGGAYCAEVARRTGAKVMKAIRIEGLWDVQHLDSYRAADFHMVDGFGDGRMVDPAFIRHRQAERPLVLAGGLTPENVAKAALAVEPFAVDTASGTEASPGIKDPERLTAFFAAVESLAARPEPEPVE